MNAEGRRQQNNKKQIQIFSVLGLYNRTRRINLIYQNYSRYCPSTFITIFSYL
jgi:hypothetical protein